MIERENEALCKLCRSSSDLRVSHFIPAAAYKILARLNQSPPVVVSDKVAIQSGKQMEDYLLCSTCERRFSENGENWVLGHCFRGDNNFKLKSMILTQEALWGNDGIKAYPAANVPEIKIDKLAYFAASIIWRGAVHQWKLDRIPVTRLEIGPKYEKELRQYLMGKAPFPSNAVVWVSVIPTDELSHTFTPPFGEKDLRQFWKYRFTVLGLRFIFLLGNRLDKEARLMCSYRSPENWIYSGTDVGDHLIRELAPKMQTAIPKGKLSKGR